MLILETDWCDGDLSGDACNIMQIMLYLLRGKIESMTGEYNGDY